jgi:GT2 family glycosyltransferase
MVQVLTELMSAGRFGAYANFVVRRIAIEAIGGFDPTVMFYGEDMTLAKRLHVGGKTIFPMDFFPS